jgi:hypothetical protein
VGDYLYVDIKELKEMMDPSHPRGKGLKWSPWFGHIVDDLLVKWWKDLDQTLTTNEHVNLDSIHRF